MEIPSTSHHLHLHPHPPPPPKFNGSLSPGHSIPMLLPVFILFFILICFLSIFLFRDLVRYLSAMWPSRGPRPPAPPNGEAGNADPGLDPSIIASFPTLPYSAVRGLQEGKCGRECAVCLSEFSEGDVIRLLTVCCHAFHPICIDSWLAAHTTCPLCRSDLEAPPDEAAVQAVKEVVGVGVGDHTITIDDDENDEVHLATIQKSRSIVHSEGTREENHVHNMADEEHGGTDHRSS